jgi:hypothetical protein
MPSCYYLGFRSESRIQQCTSEPCRASTDCTQEGNGRKTQSKTVNTQHEEVNYTINLMAYVDPRIVAWFCMYRCVMCSLYHAAICWQWHGHHFERACGDDDEQCTYQWVRSRSFSVLYSLPSILSALISLTPQAQPLLDSIWHSECNGMASDGMEWYGTGWHAIR